MVANGKLSKFAVAVGYNRAKVPLGGANALVVGRSRSGGMHRG